jgi:beta-lactamase class D
MKPFSVLPARTIQSAVLSFIVLITFSSCSQAELPASVEVTVKPSHTSLATATALPDPEPHWAALFRERDLDGCLVVYDQAADRMLRYNPDACAQAYYPVSTFKILNTLIGLDSGVVTGKDHVFEWDGVQRPVPEWNKDHSLETAFKNSVVWYYQELARQVGKERMQQYLDQVGYGNRQIGPLVDNFWLSGPLAISPDEQVAFLQRLYQNDLPFSDDSINLVKELMVIEATPDYILRGKSGLNTSPSLNMGWLVGWLEQDGRTLFYATYVESQFSNSRLADARYEITREALRTLGLLAAD